MTEPFKLALEPEDHRDGVVIWMIRVGVALAFVVYGMEKLRAAPGSPWVVLFERIGLGQWFRYATGATQLTGAALLVVPRTTIVGAATLASTMVGAIVVNCFVLHSVVTAIIPGMLLAAIVLVGFRWR
jgi:uncharacterized membrane protein YphA (DoxX/SURF4 family)